MYLGTCLTTYVTLTIKGKCYQKLLSPWANALVHQEIRIKRTVITPRGLLSNAFGGCLPATSLDCQQQTRSTKQHVQMRANGKQQENTHKSSWTKCARNSHEPLSRPSPFFGAGPPPASF